MRLRWKFFLILLAVSLVPMVVITAVNREHAIKLGRAIADEGRSLLAAIVKNELRQTAEDYALVIRRSKSAMDFSLSVLTAEAERALFGPVQGVSPLYSAAETTVPGKAPPDMSADAGYARRLPGGGTAPLAVSRGHPVVYAVPGSRAEAGEELRLAGLSPTFALVGNELGNLYLFASVTLEDGVQVTFPGHAGYPADYDPRTQPWYRAAIKAHAPNRPGGAPVIFNDPAVDPATGQVVMTLSKALVGPDGRVVGVASLDTPLTRVLQEQEIASQWSEAMRTFVVAPAKNPETGRPSLYVWAQRSYENQAPDWKSAINFERLESTDAAGLAALIETMAWERSGVVELPYNGEDSFWAFSRLLSGTSFLCVVPKSMLASLSERASAEILGATREIIRLSGVAVAIVLLVVTFAAFLITRAFVRPLLRMIEAWKQLGSGDFAVRLNLRVGDERQSLIDAFNETVPVLADHVRLQRSLELAQEVQRNLLPTAPPDIVGLDIAGIGLSCDETGGDYFDYRAVTRDGEVCLDTAVGDVTGHGVSSALLMATARALLLATEDSETPAQRVSRANRLLCRDVGESGRFMTLLAMEIRPRTGHARYVRAGHDPAMVYDPQTDAFTLWPGQGLPLGIDPDYAYAENDMPFDKPGLVLAIGTDGIWEARGPSGEMYGKERFMEAVRRTAQSTAKAIVDAVLEDLAAFRAGRRQEDDVTLVVVKKA
ncbi:MAG: SpoIIE family protein phosphatase [Solidesulfovibrio sp.]